jgi:putative ATPase
MKQLGYGKGYRYAHDEDEGVAGMDCLPEALAGKRYYEPGRRGEEAAIADRLEEARRLRQEKKDREPK